MRNGNVLALCLLLVVSASFASADVWDVGSPNDSGTGTQNELTHGSQQTHDLAATAGPVADQDWYKLGQPPYSSWEVLIDSTSTDVGFGISLDRIGSDGATVVQSSSALSALGFSRSLRWENTTSTSVINQHLRVRSTACTTNCTANDVYQVRAFDTTYAIPRFNNSASQTTTLIIQNTASYSIGGTLYFWNAAGALLKTLPLAVSPATTLAPKQVLILGLAGVTELVGQSGSITVTNDGRYADLSGKAVALEPSTGFSFDTPLVGRPR